MKANLLIVLMLLVIGASGATAQETAVSGADLLARLERSLKKTGEGPFRIHISNEVGDTTEGPWLLSVTSIIEVILPDRNRRRYANHQYTEIINIGYRLFSKFPDGRWIEDETLIPYVGRHPTKFPVAPDDPLRSYTESRNGDAVIITAHLKPGATPGITGIKSQTFSFYFDSSGVLFKIQSIIHNRSSWVRGTQTFEYDPTIRIEAPID